MDLEFWKVGILSFKKFGVYYIFRIFGGEYNNHYIKLRFNNRIDFKDFESLDEHGKIRYTSELYKSVIFSINNNEITFYNSEDEAKKYAVIEIINSIVKDNDNDYSKAADDIDKFMTELSRKITTERC